MNALLAAWFGVPVVLVTGDDAAVAVAASARVPAHRTGPITVRMRFKQTLIPEIAEAFSTITRPTPHSVAWTSETMPAAYRLVRVMYRYLSPD